jgi:hypothetical protein
MREHLEKLATHLESLDSGSVDAKAIRWAQAEIERLRASPFQAAGPGMVINDPAPHAARAPVITGQVWPKPNS